VGCSFEFDPANNILRYAWEGDLTDEVLLEGDAAGRRLLAARPPCRGIQDFSKVTTVEASRQTIMKIASQPPAYGSGQAVVFVAPQDVVFGLSRMFATIGERSRPRAYVVRTMDEAYGLLEVDSPEFSPISVPEIQSGPFELTKT
jgi:hypothetical protein